MRSEKINILVHVGKSGGSTITRVLQKNKVSKYKIVHIREAKFLPEASYVIIARDPVSRAVSAFNWRYKIVVEEERQMNRFNREREILLKYGNIETLAGMLYDHAGQENVEALADAKLIHHIKEDIDFHIGKLLVKCRPDHIGGVVMQETLNRDAQRIFGLTACERRKYNPVKDPISDNARANLRRFFLKDYLCLTKLHCWGKISNENMKLLLN